MVTQVLEDQAITSIAERMVLVALAWHSDDKGVCWPSIQRIADICVMTKRGVYKTLAILKSKQKIAIKSGRGRTHVNHYQIKVNTIHLSDEKVNEVHLLEPLKGEPYSLKGEYRSPESSGTVILQSFKALKGEPVQSFKALKAASQNRNGEQKSIQALLSMFSAEERTAYGGNWTLRYRDCPDKFVRVLNDLQTQQKEGPIPDSWAAIADLRWREFKPETKR